jgi:hypothetical protein
LLELNRHCLKGLALGHAGNTSHTVILARSFGIPTLTGMAIITGVRWEQEEAILDAELGVLLTGLTDTARRYYVLERRRLERRYARLRRFIEQPGQSQDGVRLEIAANVSTAEEVAPAFAAGAESIGLFRTEMLFMDRTEAPTEDEQFEVYRRALATAGGRTVIIRTLDVGGDKPLPYLNLPPEENPFLGCRARRSSTRCRGGYLAEEKRLFDGVRPRFRNPALQNQRGDCPFAGDAQIAATDPLEFSGWPTGECGPVIGDSRIGSGDHAPQDFLASGSATHARGFPRTVASSAECLRLGRLSQELLGPLIRVA